MELARSILKFVLAIVAILMIVFAKVWLMAKGVGMILDIEPPLIPMALIVVGLSIDLGGSN